MLTESCHSQYECDHDGDPGDPECLLPVALSLMRLQTHAALKKTCSETNSVRTTISSFILSEFYHVYAMIILLTT